MLAVWQVDRVEIVERTVGKLHKARPIDANFIEVKRFLVMWLEAEHDFLAIERKIGTPKRTVQGSLGHELGEFSRRRKPIENQQAAAGHRHVTQPVTCLVTPFGTCWKRHVDH